VGWRGGCGWPAGGGVAGVVYLTHVDELWPQDFHADVTVLIRMARKAGEKFGREALK
jgi:hypothetical protein